MTTIAIPAWVPPSPDNPWGMNPRELRRANRARAYVEAFNANVAVGQTMEVRSFPGGNVWEDAVIESCYCALAYDEAVGGARIRFIADDQVRLVSLRDIRWK